MAGARLVSERGGKLAGRGRGLDAVAAQGRPASRSPGRPAPRRSRGCRPPPRCAGPPRPAGRAGSPAWWRPEPGRWPPPHRCQSGRASPGGTRRRVGRGDQQAAGLRLEVEGLGHVGDHRPAGTSAAAGGGDDKAVLRSGVSPTRRTPARPATSSAHAPPALTTHRRRTRPRPWPRASALPGEDRAPMERRARDLAWLSAARGRRGPGSRAGTLVQRVDVDVHRGGLEHRPAEPLRPQHRAVPARLGGADLADRCRGSQPGREHLVEAVLGAVRAQREHAARRDQWRR